MSDSGLPARKAAIHLLEQVTTEGRLIAECLAAGALDALSPEDRARAQRLATLTLRWLERADRLLSRHLRKPPPSYVKNALRLGTVELIAGGAAHGVVNDIVQIIGRHRRHGALKGLANAVLRKIAQTDSAEWEALRIPRLPNWLRKPLVRAWGPEAVGAMEKAHFDGAPTDITIPAGPDNWAEKLSGRVVPTGSLRLAGPGQISALPGYDEGAWWVQDAAATVAARWLDPQKGERVLDLCAAPGGKTMQLAAAGAQVRAVDSSAARLERLRQNLSRTGLVAEVVVGDVFDEYGEYDAVLLDAPCSATGTIRRHPDLPFAKDGSDFGALIELQSAMIDHAWSLVRPGGRLVFCTCSLLPDEGEVQGEEALARLSGASVAPCDLAGILPEWMAEEGGIRLRPDYWPDLGGMDGFYILRLNKDA